MMEKNEIEMTDIDTWKCEKLGEGAYNRVTVTLREYTYAGQTGRWVIKETIGEDPLNEASRAVRKWNELNPDYPAFQIGKRWIAPYFGNQFAEDEERAKKLIDIYVKTGMIILDGAGSGNILSHNGQEICVDVDLAYRRGSFASDDYLRTQKDQLMSYLRHAKFHKKPKTVAVTEIFLYLEKCAPEATLQRAVLIPWLMDSLHIFREQQVPITASIVQKWLEIRELDPLNEIPGYYFTPSVMKTLCDNSQELTQDALLAFTEVLPWNLTWVGEVTSGTFFKATRRTLKSHPSWQTKTCGGCTLLHSAAMHPNEKLISSIVHWGIDLNAITSAYAHDGTPARYPQMTAVEIALASSSVIGSQMACFLMERGATVPLDRRALFAAHPTDPLASWEYYLHEWVCLSSDSHHLSEDRKNELLNLLQQYPQVATWVLNEQGDTLVHRAFLGKDNLVIDRLLSHSSWPLLSKIKHPIDGRTLLHLMAYGDREDLLPYLTAIDPNAWTHYPQRTALHDAALCQKGALCQWLLEHGANPMLQNVEQKTAELKWSGDPAQNPMMAFRKELYYFAQNKGGLTDLRKNELYGLLIKYPHLLTWPLHSRGYTVLHEMFLSRHYDLIERLFRHPQWEELVSISSGGHSLLEVIAYRNLLQYYDCLKPLCTTKRELEEALMTAVKQGHTDFCERLMNDGVGVNDISSDGKRFSDIWQERHPLKPNPFNRTSLQDQTGGLIPLSFFPAEGSSSTHSTAGLKKSQLGS